MPARQISSTVWMVGSGTDEDALTDPHDCHCYLVWDGSGGLLVDAGTGLGAQRWRENIREVCDPSALNGVLLTHYHADHAGGAEAASRAGLRVLASQETARALEVADEEHTSLARAREAGVYPEDYRLAPTNVDQIVREGTAVYTGTDVVVTVLEAPGHCDGHLVALLSDSARHCDWMFSGDCLFAGGAVSIQALPDCRLDRYASTVIRLADRRPDALLPGHGDMVLSSAWRDVANAAESFARLIPPRNLLSG